MGNENTSFDAGVIAAVASILGVGYLFGGMLSVVSNGGSSFMLLSGSEPGTLIVGVVLSLAAGLLATGHKLGRILGTTAFGAIVIFGRPSLSTPEPITIAVFSVSVVLCLYMIFRNPVPEPERSDIDESASAHRIGSTLR